LLLQLHINLLARPDETSFAAFCWPLGLNAHRDGAAAPALFTKGSKTVMIIRHRIVSQPWMLESGQRIRPEESGEQLQGFVEGRVRVQKAR
jgi:hypothetical protein